MEISRRFCGPPESGNGGYTSGSLAALLERSDVSSDDGPDVEVTLRLPPPLEVSLEVRGTPDGIALLHGEDLVAEATRTTVDIEPPAPVAPNDAEQCEHDYLDISHPFETCFTCGPARAEGDGLRILPGATLQRPGVVASRWTPDETLAADGHNVDTPFVWAALDCPSGWSHMASGLTAVLGRMAIHQFAPVRVGEHYVVVGEATGRDGRKCFANSALYDSAENVTAVARTIWITID